MGSIVSYIMSWISPAPAISTTPDPDTGLSALDRKLIQDTWAMVADKKTRKANGVEFFVRLFEAYPYMQDYFPAFKGLPESELRNSPKLKAHALSVMFSIGSLVDSMEDGEALVGLVQKLAVSHVDRNVKSKQFDELAKFFVPFLKAVLGEQVFTPQAAEAWTKLLSAQTALVKAREDEVANEA